jgi:hypothetical protein
MTLVLSTCEYNILSYENNVYKIQFKDQTKGNRSYEALLKSLTKTQLIVGATITSDYNIIQFKASSFTSFPQYLREKKKIPFISAMKMLKSLATQLEYLICNYSKTFLGYDMERILMIDGEKFVYLCNEYLVDIAADKNVVITCPFSKSDFHHELAPELVKVNKLPAKIHYKVSYYSLASLLVHSLEYDKISEYENNDDVTISITNQLLDNSYIAGSKIDWLLKRSLQEKAEERSIILI